MKFTNTTILNRLLVCLGLLFLSAYFPIKALALSNDTQQHFTPAITTHWAVTSGGNGYALHLGSTNVDTNDVSAQNVALWSPLPANTGVTVTYTDPASANPQNVLKIDLNTTSNSQEVEIIANDGINTPVTALAGSYDIVPSCQMGSPVPQPLTDLNTWETAFIDVHTLGAITSVQFIFTDNIANPIAQFTGTIYLDNLRGDPGVSCLPPTSTATQTATNTATLTAVNSYTPSNTPTVTATNTPTQTGTNTPMATGTNTPTQTATNTGNTATATNTRTNTLTPISTNTATVTATSTPAACQIEVYPNPMDFTSLASILNCQTGKCIMFSCLPLNATMKIYTVSLSLVRTFGQGSVTSASNLLPGYGYIAWDGTNGTVAPVASGLYFYVVNTPGGVNTFGKFAISKSLYGP